MPRGYKLLLSAERARARAHMKYEKYLLLVVSRLCLADPGNSAQVNSSALPAHKNHDYVCLTRPPALGHGALLSPCVKHFFSAVN